MGQMPLFVQVAERPLHAVDLGVAFSTDQGGSATASWTNRNLFGNAEVLTLSAAATELGGSASRAARLRCRRAADFPRLVRARAVAGAERCRRSSSRCDAYDRTAALASAIVTRKLDPELSVSGGVSFEEARIKQEGVSRSYTLPQLPLSVTYDSTHSLFDPTHGFKATLSVTPTYSLGGGATVRRHDAARHGVRDRPALRLDLSRFRTVAAGQCARPQHPGAARAGRHDLRGEHFRRAARTSGSMPAAAAPSAAGGISRSGRPSPTARRSAAPRSRSAASNTGSAS